MNTYSVNLLYSNTSGTVTAIVTDDSGLNYNVLDTGGGTLLVEDLPSNYTGTITATLTDATNCTETLVITPVTCNCPTIPTPANPADAFICAGDAPVALCVDNPGAGYSIQWYDAATGGALLATGACYTPTAAGTAYAVVVEDVNGCSSGAAVAVTLTQGTAISITEAAGVCSSDLQTYDVPLNISGGAAPYTVTSGSLTVVNNGGGSYTVSGIPSGTPATVNVTDANGCLQSITLTSVNCACASVPAPANPADAFICAGDVPVALSVTSPGAGYTINWYNVPAGGTPLGSGTAYTPTAPGTYYAEAVEDLSGCVSARIAVTLTQGTPIVITDNGSACAADLTTYDITVAVTGGAEPYTFDPGAYTVTPIFDAWVIEDVPSGTPVVLNLTDANGCTASLDLGVTTCNCAAVPAPVNPVNGAYCQGSAPAALSVAAPAAGYVIQWYNTATGGTPLATGNTYTPATAGTYYAEALETATGCVSTRIAVTLTVTLLPAAPAAASPAPYCEGAVITALTATGSGGTLTWYSDAGLTTVAGTGNSLLPATPATGSLVSYWVAETNNGCQGNATQVTVSVIVCNCTPPAPPVLTVNSLSICEGEDTPQFTATAQAGTEVRWYFGGTLAGTGSTFVPVQAGTYTVTAYDTAQACESTPVNATFELLPQPVAGFTLSDATCVGDAQTITFTGNASGSAVYNWNFGAGATPAIASGPGSHSVTWGTPGIKTVSLLIDDNGCTDTLELVIAVSDMNAGIEPAQIFVNPGQSTVLTVTASSGLGTVLNYAWSPDAGCNDCASVTVTPTESVTTYTVTVTDEYGCAAVASATLNLVYKNQVLIPNAFSPNNDGVNDVFRLTGYNISEVELHIYNRWGEEVFFNSAANMTQGWNGEYKGKQQEIGVYVYYALVTFADGTTETLKGNITLVR
ncbi:hypothetical protein C7N43_36035 [Sphingobacteriales bacterium UPWRP_1]|nr:hypothetical protein C7N43_36035 [Sphingobacteriales bacterium UPWRP_1]